MFRLLEDVYSPIDSETKDHLIDELYIVMMNVLQPIARFLTRQTVSDQPTKHAGPTFEFYQFDSARNVQGELRDLCDDVVDIHPELKGLSWVLNQGE